MKTSIAIGTLALAAIAGSAFGSVDINGGTSWGGWTSVGQSNQLGVYGSGSQTAVYEVYTTVFSFNNHAVTGGAINNVVTNGASGFASNLAGFSSGAFANGNSILGVGVRGISGGSITGMTPTIRFDLDNDSYLADAPTVGSGNGRTSFTNWSEFRDFTVQFEGTNSWRGGTLSMQAGNGTSNGGPNNTQAIVGGIGSGVSYDWAFRAFAQSDSYQMFFDLNAMSSLYGGANPFGLNANFTGIGAVGSNLGISLNGMGTNNVAFGVAIPTPGTAALLGLGGLMAARRRR